MAVDSTFHPSPGGMPTDTDVFLAYVRKVLVPSLRPGDIVVLDNLRPHKARR